MAKRSRPTRTIPRSDSEKGRYRIHGQCERSHLDGVEEVIEARGAIPFYLPAYSPDLNPIEQLFAKLKSMLRKIAAYSLKQAAYTVDSRCAAIASSLTEITRSECAAYLANSRYGQSYRETL